MRKTDHAPFPANINFTVSKFRHISLAGLPNYFLQSGLRRVYVDDTCFDLQEMANTQTFNQPSLPFFRPPYQHPQVLPQHHPYYIRRQNYWHSSPHPDQHSYKKITGPRRFHPHQPPYYLYNHYPAYPAQFRVPRNPTCDNKSAINYLQSTVPNSVDLRNSSPSVVRSPMQYRAPSLAMSPLLDDARTVRICPKAVERPPDPSNVVFNALCSNLKTTSPRFGTLNTNYRYLPGQSPPINPNFMAKVRPVLGTGESKEGENSDIKPI